RGLRHRVRGRARRRRRTRRADDQGPVEVRRRAQQPRRFRQFRCRARLDPVLSAVARTRQWRSDRGDGVCDLRRPAAGALQRVDRRSRQAGLCREIFYRRARTRRRNPGAAAGLSRLPWHSQGAGGRNRGLYPPDRFPDGVAIAGIFRQVGED
ncbi:hypothetical protein OY671_012268, partial [Metschnikowia pulcherrima]